MRGEREGRYCPTADRFQVQIPHTRHLRSLIKRRIQRRIQRTIQWILEHGQFAYLEDLEISIIQGAQQGDMLAKERVFLYYRNYVKKVVKEFFAKQTEPDDRADLLAVGYFSIAQSLKYYDYAKNPSFIGFLSVICKRALVNEIKRNYARRSAVEVVDIAGTDIDLGGTEEPAATSDIALLKLSPDPFPLRIFTRLENGEDFNEACRNLKVQPLLARLFLAGHFGRNQVQMSIIDVSIHQGQMVLFFMNPDEPPSPRMLLNRVRRKTGGKGQPTLFDEGLNVA